MTDLLGKLAEHGILGLVCAVLLYVLSKKDQELTAERAARLVDAKSFTELALKLKTEDAESKDRIESLLDELERHGR